MMSAPVPPNIFVDQDPGDETPPSVRDLGVVCWRFDCLTRAGYPDLIAITLAESATVDLHDAVELLSRGCPVSEAERILL